jgi:hypothetical protein
MSQENVEIVRRFLATFVEVDEGLVGPERLSFAAELYYRRQNDQSTDLSAQDLAAFSKDARALKTLGYWEDPEVISEATRIVHDHWDAVLRVADALEAGRTLTRKQVAEAALMNTASSVR